MKDVIFQGSRNSRLPSGMAEVVLHMVRDEKIEEEPDIEDIDSALEELDEQAEAVEERLAPELEGDAVNAQADAGAEVAGANRYCGGQLVARHERSCKRRAQTDIVAENDSQALAPVDADATTPARKSRAQQQHHKRHWRPRRLALDFAPGEVVSVTRRLYRSGESEYLLNGRICRLRDIQDLFSGNGTCRARTTRSSSRGASAKFFRPSRWIAARSSKRRRASRSSACASAPPKRVSNPPART